MGAPTYLHAEHAQAAQGLAARELFTQIEALLQQGKKVAVLLSGGSALKILPFLQAECEQSTLTIDQYAQISVTLVDERYGEVGHAESNGKAVEESGFGQFMRLKGMQWIPVLMAGEKQEKSAQRMNALVTEWFTMDQIFTIGLFGAGPDFHTASNMPTVRNGTLFVHQYSAEEYYPAISLDEKYDNPFRQRLGLSEAAIRALDARVLLLTGDDKKPVLEHFHRADLTIDEAPVMALHNAKTTVITDQKVG